MCVRVRSYSRLYNTGVSIPTLRSVNGYLFIQELFVNVERKRNKDAGTRKAVISSSFIV